MDGKESFSICLSHDYFGHICLLNTPNFDGQFFSEVTV